MLTNAPSKVEIVKCMVNNAEDLDSIYIQNADGVILEWILPETLPFPEHAESVAIGWCKLNGYAYTVDTAALG